MTVNHLLCKTDGNLCFNNGEGNAPIKLVNHGKLCALKRILSLAFPSITLVKMTPHHRSLPSALGHFIWAAEALPGTNLLQVDRQLGSVTRNSSKHIIGTSPRGGDILRPENWMLNKQPFLAAPSHPD